MLTESRINVDAIESSVTSAVKVAQKADPAIVARSSYWDSYYAQGRTLVAPSQFATFIASECPDHAAVLDIGCGNGRDALFFAQLGYHVIGIDASESAIGYCEQRIQRCFPGGSAHKFIRRDVMDLRDDTNVEKALGLGPKVLYSRFFLHAIDVEEEDAFLDFIYRGLSSGDVLALEFRTLADEGRSKVTGHHYRRYIDPKKLVFKLRREGGLQIDYWVEGVGFAKYKDDDAHVCRILASRSHA